MDHFRPPVLKGRQGWLVATQILVFVSILGISFGSPAEALFLFSLSALLVAVASASQDSAADAFRSHLLKPEEFVSGAAASYLGYRLGLIFCGSTSLMVADHYSWRTAYWFILGVYFVGSISAFFGGCQEKDDACERAPSISASRSFFAALKEFLSRKNSFEVIGFILLYKMNESAVTSLETTFLLQLGFTKSQIGEVITTFGLAAALASALAGTVLINKIGIKRGLLIFGVLQAFSEGAFYFLARYGKNDVLLNVAVFGETFFSAMGYMALTIFFMKLCHPAYTAAQFALFTSIMAVTRALFGIAMGWFVAAMGWTTVMAFGVLLVLPSLLLLSRYDHWNINE
jgi:PAT family beta-lactamase induction signal transducer AmpG